MTIANLYRQLKQILDDSNDALISRGFVRADNLSAIPEIVKNNAGKLRLLVGKEITEVTAEDLEGITAILPYIFYQCSNLESVAIPDGVTDIGTNAFRGCSKLESVVIPSSIKTIGDFAFGGCTNLSIYIHSTTPPALGVSSIPTSTWIWVPKGCEKAYRQHAKWSEYSSRIWEMQ